jgi:predicted NodU family carbamoyl transferase
MSSRGFNDSRMRDSSARIACDGEWLFAMAEESIGRINHDVGFRRLPIRACPDFPKVRSGQLDIICRGWSAARTIFATERLPCSVARGKENRR